ncbi:unnamed protein product [Vitrella brassicaformis CCMP3155]|uniref:Uncharacterized protein n=1 Tax=Vitrella brassicaformis (strain CCMP3155) TaxID=1169540 RepID=A0A0G4FUQ2_VITBC|nr:unnamed protein product [Vitrella brassicaformis CCMP3155]|mmetsp:Transcript_37162/g.93275  ORF Transcript_37162/g.93275 Transcript_37162/m.93275 type:complete len:204 (-) Transcript_37162:378-989(-)|eukprot:CEM18675.1 unnamed protein product [Vitrella brassicaformis CCMP3155]
MPRKEINQYIPPSQTGRGGGFATFAVNPTRHEGHPYLPSTITDAQLEAGITAVGQAATPEMRDIAVDLCRLIVPLVRLDIMNVGAVVVQHQQQQQTGCLKTGVIRALNMGGGQWHVCLDLTYVPYTLRPCEGFKHIVEYKTRAFGHVSVYDHYEYPQEVLMTQYPQSILAAIAAEHVRVAGVLNLAERPNVQPIAAATQLARR